MTYREPTYLELDENEDFSLTAHVDSDGYQRVALTGYIYKQKSDGVYRAPLLPDLFFGSNGQQLQGSWRQYLTEGDHIILRRDGGNPSVPDSDLAWRKVSSTPQRPQRTTRQAPYRPTFEIGGITYLVVGLAVGGFLIWLFTRK